MLTDNRVLFPALIALCACALLVTCTDRDSDEDDDDTPSTIIGPSANRISVMQPDSLTVWHGGRCCDTIRWSAAQGDSVQLRLYKDSSFVEFFPGWIANDSMYVTELPVPTDWDETSSFRIQVLDWSGNQGWSGFFSVQPDTSAVMIVTSPNAQSVWNAGGSVPAAIQWTVSGLSGDLARIDLFRKGQFVTTLADSTPNDRSEVLQGDVDYLWGSGTGFQVRVVDTEGYYGWSEPFSITPAQCASMTVSMPDSSTIWLHGQSDVTITWQKTCADSVLLELRRGEVYKDSLSPWVPNTGTYTRKRIVKSSWGAYDDFQVRVRDRSGVFGVSQRFSIRSDSMQSLLIAQPSTGDVWRWDQDSVRVDWSQADGDSVRAQLFADDTLAGDLFGWAAADSTLTISGDRLRALAVSGSRMAIKLLDNNGYWGWSDRFRIDTTGSLVVNEPSRSTVWLHGDRGHAVSWTGSTQDSVATYVYKGDSLLGPFARLVGSAWRAAVRDSAVPASWGVGDDYRIRVSDRWSNYGWSAPFSIRADTTPRFTVLYPDSSTHWYAGQRIDSIAIAYADSDTAIGDSALAVLMLGDSVIDTLAPWLGLDSVLPVESRLSSMLIAANGYYVRITDNAHNEGRSVGFRIGADSLDGLQVTMEPDSVLYRGQANVRVTWTGCPSDSSVVLLMRGDAVVDTFVAWGVDSGTALRAAPAPAWWGSGSGFAVKVVTADGCHGTSDTFSIEADSLKRIRVLTPNAATVWGFQDAGRSVSWSGPLTDSATVEMYKSDTYLGLFSACAGDSLTSCARSTATPGSWGTGAGYRVRVTTREGYYGWSEEFEVGE